LYENQLFKNQTALPLDYIIPVRTMEEILRAEKPKITKLLA
jgi:hypothetical protein